MRRDWINQERHNGPFQGKRSHDALFKPPQKYSSLMSCASSYTSVTFNCLLNRIQTPQHGTQDHASLGNASLTWNSSAKSIFSTVGMTITKIDRGLERCSCVERYLGSFGDSVWAPEPMQKKSRMVAHIYSHSAGGTETGHSLGIPG